jgi:hypothetical protein
VEILILLALLASDSIEARDRAAGRLRQLGPDAWPALFLTLKHEDPEFRGRALDVLHGQQLPAEWSDRHPDLRAAALLRKVDQLLRERRDADLKALGPAAVGPLVSILHDPLRRAVDRNRSLWVLAESSEPGVLLAVLRVVDDPAIIPAKCEAVTLGEMAQHALSRLRAEERLPVLLPGMTPDDAGLARRWLDRNAGPR